MQYSVLCREAVAHTTAAKLLAVGKQALPEFPDAVLAKPAQIPSMSDCEVWAVPAAPPDVFNPAHSDLPVLLVTEPSTPRPRPTGLRKLRRR